MTIAERNDLLLTLLPDVAAMAQPALRKKRGTERADVIQEATFGLVLCITRHGHLPREHLKAMAVRYALGHAENHAKRFGPRRTRSKNSPDYDDSPFDERDLPIEPKPHWSIEADDLLDYLAVAPQQRPKMPAEHLKRMMQLRFRDGLTYAEVGEAMGWEETTILRAVRTQCDILREMLVSC